MVWEPFALAIFFGLIVSAGIYFIFVWPRVEPEEPGESDERYAARLREAGIDPNEIDEAE